LIVNHDLHACEIKQLARCPLTLDPSLDGDSGDGRKDDM
jgi:hypothetical protein